MAAQRTYLAIDLKSFYASVECVDRHLDPLTTNLVVADASRTEKTICLAVSPSLKAYKIPGRARLFEAVQRVKEVNAQRLQTAIQQHKAVRGEDGKYRFASTSFDANALNADPALGLSYIVAPPRICLLYTSQTLLVAVHHLDVGWRPSDMTQRNGRIIRQGNQNKQVYVYNYVTEGTFDGYLWQTLESKQKFISQIMTSKSPMRSCDDIDEQALSYAEIKALCAGDPRIREKMDLDVQVAKLKVLRGDFQNQKYRLEDKLLKTFPEEIQKQKTRIAALQQDSQTAAAHPQDKENFCGMTIKGMVYDDKKVAGERLLLARQERCV